MCCGYDSGVVFVAVVLCLISCGVVRCSVAKVGAAFWSVSSCSVPACFGVLCCVAFQTLLLEVLCCGVGCGDFLCSVTGSDVFGVIQDVVFVLCGRCCVFLRAVVSCFPLPGINVALYSVLGRQSLSYSMYCVAYSVLKAVVLCFVVAGSSDVQLCAGCCVASSGVEVL